MGYVVYMRELAFTPVDEHGVPTGTEEIVKRGGAVPSYVPPFVINALANSGAIVDAGPAQLAPALVAPVALPSADAPPGPDGQPPLLDLGTGAGDTDTTPGARPKDGDSKAKWEDYAVSVGIDRAEAESLTKAKLQERVAEREAANS